MKIFFYTNVVSEGWSARNLETGIGGSEEKLIEFSEWLVKNGHDVTVFMNGEYGIINGVNYKAHREYKAWEPCDIFVSFKNKDVFNNSINTKVKMHWTTEIESEDQWPKHIFNQVVKIITISNFHRKHMFKIDEKIDHSYLWADLENLEKSRTNKIPKTMLYCSSYDRGLEQLLSSWSQVKKNLNVDKLYIAYGWDFFDRASRNNPSRILWKESMNKLMQQEGVEHVGRLGRDDLNKLYWQSEYWCLPLNSAFSELFCINAVKAQYCGAIPVVRRIGALQETVKEFIDFDLLLKEIPAIDPIEMKKGNLLHAKKFELNIQCQKLFNIFSEKIAEQ